MINYVNESLSQEPNAFSSCPGCSIPFGLQKFPPGQFPSLSKEENWRVQTHMLVIYSLGNLVSLFGTATHTHIHTHTSEDPLPGPLLCCTTPKDAIDTVIREILQRHGALWSRSIQCFPWIFPLTMVKVESTFQ